MSVNDPALLLRTHTFLLATPPSWIFSVITAETPNNLWTTIGLPEYIFPGPGAHQIKKTAFYRRSGAQKWKCLWGVTGPLSVGLISSFQAPSFRWDRVDIAMLVVRNEAVVNNKKSFLFPIFASSWTSSLQQEIEGSLDGLCIRKLVVVYDNRLLLFYAICYRDRAIPGQLLSIMNFLTVFC